MIKINPSNRPAYFFFGLLLIVTVLHQIYQKNSLRNIEKTGVEVHAVITRAYNTRGEHVDIEYQYNGKRYTNDFGTSNFEPHAGDSVVIKILPASPGGDLIFKERFYSIPVIYKSHFEWLHKVNKNL